VNILFENFLIWFDLRAIPVPMGKIRVVEEQSQKNSRNC